MRPNLEKLALWGDYLAKKTMGALTQEKKVLRRQLATNPALKPVLESKIAEIEKQLDSRVNQHDQNFLRTFYKTAKESLPSAVFNRLEDISSTRQHNHASQN